MHCESCRRELKVGEWVKLTRTGSWCAECVRVAVAKAEASLARTP